MNEPSYFDPPTEQTSAMQSQQIRSMEVQRQKLNDISDNTDLDEELEKLKDTLLKEPHRFGEKELKRMAELLKKFPEYLAVLTRRIFDINESTVLNHSESEKGLMGRFNRRSRRRKQKKYFRKINGDFHTVKNGKRILAEGDSWFEFPIFVSDVLDCLGKNEHYAIYSAASAGDWLTNMIYTRQYIEDLPIHTPDIFLISGGGNDLVGENRLSTMLRSTPDESQANKDWFEQRSRKEECESANALQKGRKGDKTANPPDIGRYVDDAEVAEGRRYLADEFYSFLNIVRLQYFLMFANIQVKYPKLRIITQGYDFAVPSNQIRFRYLFQPLVNYLLGTGTWLRQSFMLKRITEGELQRKIVKAMINDFNEMLIGVVTLKDGSENYLFGNVHHIDCRGIVGGDDWYDELHPSSKDFKRIAALYAMCIDAQEPEKIYTKDDLAEQ